MTSAVRLHGTDHAMSLTCVIADVGGLSSQGLIVLGIHPGVATLHSCVQHAVQGHCNLKVVPKAPAQVPGQHTLAEGFVPHCLCKTLQRHHNTWARGVCDTCASSLGRIVSSSFYS